MEDLSNDHKDRPNQHKKSHKLYNETRHPVFEFYGQPMKTKTVTWSEFPNRGKAIVEQILA